MQVSKWLKVQALLTQNEMSDLLNELAECQLYNVSAVIDDPKPIDKELFLMRYGEYVDALKKGKEIDLKKYRSLFSAALSVHTPEVKKIGDGRYLFRPQEPVIQMQHHTFVLSGKKCLSMVHGESQNYGLQFAYPQLFMDEHGICQKVLRTSENGQAFLKLQKWMRRSTKPTTFVINGEKKTFPIRTGKEWT